MNFFILFILFRIRIRTLKCVNQSPPRKRCAANSHFIPEITMRYKLTYIPREWRLKFLKLPSFLYFFVILINCAFFEKMWILSACHSFRIRHFPDPKWFFFRSGFGKIFLSDRIRIHNTDKKSRIRICVRIPVYSPRIQIKMSRIRKIGFQAAWGYTGIKLRAPESWNRVFRCSSTNNIEIFF